MLFRVVTIARSIAFSSSRTLPGQSYRKSWSAAPGVSPDIGRLSRIAASARSTRASGKMSSRRSLSGGMRNSTTFSR